MDNPTPEDDPIEQALDAIGRAIMFCLLPITWLIRK